jgi:hypothetical protein
LPAVVHRDDNVVRLRWYKYGNMVWDGDKEIFDNPIRWGFI